MLYVKPPNKTMQILEYGQYKWDAPMTTTGERSDRVLSVALVHTVKAGEILDYNALPL